MYAPSFKTATEKHDVQSSELDRVLATTSKIKQQLSIADRQRIYQDILAHRKQRQQEAITAMQTPDRQRLFQTLVLRKRLDDQQRAQDDETKLVMLRQQLDATRKFRESIVPEADRPRILDTLKENLARRRRTARAPSSESLLDASRQRVQTLVAQRAARQSVSERQVERQETTQLIQNYLARQNVGRSLLNLASTLPWYQRIPGTTYISNAGHFVSALPGVTQVSGVVTYVGGKIVNTSLSTAIQVSGQAAAAFFGVATGTIWIPVTIGLATVALSSLAFEITAQVPMTGKHPATGKMVIARRVIGRVLRETPGIFVGAWYPTALGRFVGGVITGTIMNLAAPPLVPAPSEQEAVHVASEQAWLSATDSLRKDLEEKYGKWQVEISDQQMLAQLNKNKPIYLKALAAKAVSVAATTTTVALAAGTAYLAVGTEGGRQIFSDLFTRWREGDTWVAPVVNNILADGILNTLGMTGMGPRELASWTTKKASGMFKRAAPKFAQSIVYSPAPESIRTFFKERVGTTVLDNLTFAAVADAAVQASVQVGTSVAIGNTIAYTKQWNSLDEARDDLARFYSGALRSANDYMSQVASNTAANLATVAAVTTGAINAGVRAMSDQGKLDDMTAEAQQLSLDARAAAAAAAGTAIAAQVAAEAAAAAATAELVRKAAEANRLKEEAFGKVLDAQRLKDQLQRNAQLEAKQRAYLIQQAEQAAQLAREKAFGSMLQKEAEQAVFDKGLLNGFGRKYGFTVDNLTQAKTFEQSLQRLRAYHPKVYKAIEEADLNSVEIEGLAYVAVKSYVPKAGAISSAYSLLRGATNIASGVMRLSSWWNTVDAATAPTVQDEQKFKFKAEAQGEAASDLNAAYRFMKPIPSGDMFRPLGFKTAVNAFGYYGSRSDIVVDALVGTNVGARYFQGVLDKPVAAVQYVASGVGYVASGVGYVASGVGTVGSAAYDIASDPLCFLSGTATRV